MPFQEVLLPTDDGIELYVRRFEPNSGPADRTLVLVHGMAEHGERYGHVTDALTQLDWNVVVPDLRGHGRSGGAHIHVRDFSEYVADVKRVLDSAELCPANTALVGHSMGGLIAARVLQQHPDCAAALALLSPLLAVQVAISPVTLSLGKVLSIVRPESRFRRRIPPEHTTRNPEAIARKATDPFSYDSVTAGWYFAMQAALRTVFARAAQILCPVLILQAGEDRIVDPQAPAQWIDRVQSADKTLRVYPEHYHELLNECDWRETLADLVGWLDPRVARGNDPPLLCPEPSASPAA